VCQPYAPAAFISQEIFLILISLEAESILRIMSMKTSNNHIGDRTRDLMASSAIPRPATPLRAPVVFVYQYNTKKNNVPNKILKVVVTSV